MLFVAGISPKIKPLGAASGCACPVCGSVSHLRIIHKYMTPHIFFIPTFHFHSEYIAVCPNCASVMELKNEKGRAFQKDAHTPIYPEDLGVFSQFR